MFPEPHIKTLFDKGPLDGGRGTLLHEKGFSPDVSVRRQHLDLVRRLVDPLTHRFQMKYSVSSFEELCLMAARERSLPDSAASESQEVLGLLRRLREIFELEIQSLEASSQSAHSASWPLKAHDRSIHERRYERLLRLRRIHAKLHNRERVLTESGALGQE
jgi:hypothetical protein